MFGIYVLSLNEGFCQATGHMMDWSVRITCITSRYVITACVIWQTDTHGKLFGGGGNLPRGGIYNPL